ncbi:MAG TPA: methionine aminopeptidase [Desulfobacter sp.]|jgi:methionyl aminopeptidase|uniref:type I methionyl aminopeptidase n=1 Tax=unclassified Desulfobacter TaxID=2634406 RepID=UPI000E9CF99C|nr:MULTISPECIES: type I methionyl aminopeptidase [unclassified Desulfobacter]MDQ1269615.1 methionyl aminopeptidase [Thermodesulfobacteriota bacterium]HRF89471.1 type I methionyl aminopeptidase [Desulfobacter postgatei]MBP8828681.1 type I methionyl aminopeptidase [Desulfobacter sp.]MBP9599790.1 type I methionyl aminopeptidase [Desulfobacter sp.]HAR34924.1 methionine aminopeptidase [Desulfobacter sp.]
MKIKSTSIRRNELCPCGSGKKFKNCCRNKKTEISLKDKYKNKYDIILKTPEQVDGIRKCGELLLSIMHGVEAMIRPGLKTDDINTYVHEQTIKAGAVPAPLNYRGYPKSVCVSINEVICHGIPGERMLEDGDIVNIDITPILNGYYADANKTFFVGTPGRDAQKIVAVAAESLRRGIEQVKPGATLGDIGHAIQKYAEGQGCSVVREFVGHGVGIDFHEQPQVLHFGRPGTGVTLVPGMVFTIEPMVNLGKKELHVLEDRWTAVTNDGSLSAQFEQTILVTDDGYESLTPYEL